MSIHIPNTNDDYRFLTPRMAQMEGSQILKIAGQVSRLVSQGKDVCNLTIGDFRPEHFPVPTELVSEIKKAYDQNETNYPPAAGVVSLREAIADLYRERFGLDYGIDGVSIGSGARPPLYATWRLFVAPGDRTISFLPAWNVGYYAHLCQADHHFIPTTAENNFHPTVEQVTRALPNTKLVVLNSPLNPTGTMISKETLTGIAQAIVDENKKRRNERPVMLLFDQVYWMLFEQGHSHYSPVSLVPEVAPYVIHVDAISKCFACTGVRVGWAVLPPAIQSKMKFLIAHVGAWAGRAEQVATGAFLRQPQLMMQYMKEMREKVSLRLQKLYFGIQQMKASGLPVDAIAPQGAIYLSFRVDLIGRGFSSNEEIRNWLLEEAGLAVVPFQAFDLPEDSGWFRMSVGAVGLDELDAVLERLEKVIKSK